MSIDEVLRGAPKNNLAGDTNRGILLETDRRLLGISVVENDRDTGFGDASLAALVDQILRRRCQRDVIGGVAIWRLTWRFCARTVDMLVMPRTKQIESRMFDFPLPLSPVMELKLSSLDRSVVARNFPSLVRIYHPEITVRTAYDLKPWKTVRLIHHQITVKSHLTSIITSITLILVDAGLQRRISWILCFVAWHRRWRRDTKVNK